MKLYDALQIANDALGIEDEPAPMFAEATVKDIVAADPTVTEGVIHLLRATILLLAMELNEAKRYA